MSWEPIDDVTGEWIVYDETGAPIGRYGQNGSRAKEVARMCGGADKGIAAIYREATR